MVNEEDSLKSPSLHKTLSTVSLRVDDRIQYHLKGQKDPLIQKWYTRIEKQTNGNI